MCMRIHILRYYFLILYNVQRLKKNEKRNRIMLIILPASTNVLAKSQQGITRSYKNVKTESSSDAH